VGKLQQRNLTERISSAVIRNETRILFSFFWIRPDLAAYRVRRAFQSIGHVDTSENPTQGILSLRAPPRNERDCSSDNRPRSPARIRWQRRWWTRSSVSKKTSHRRLPRWVTWCGSPGATILAIRLIRAILDFGVSSQRESDAHITTKFVVCPPVSQSIVLKLPAYFVLHEIARSAVLAGSQEPVRGGIEFT
jgi:hypothetical protein